MPLGPIGGLMTYRLVLRLSRARKESDRIVHVAERFATAMLRN